MSIYLDTEEAFRRVFRSVDNDKDIVTKTKLPFFAIRHNLNKLPRINDESFFRKGSRNEVGIHILIQLPDLSLLEAQHPTVFIVINFSVWCPVPTDGFDDDKIAV